MPNKKITRGDRLNPEKNMGKVFSPEPASFAKDVWNAMQNSKRGQLDEAGINQISRKYGVGRSTVYRILDQSGQIRDRIDKYKSGLSDILVGTHMEVVEAIYGLSSIAKQAVEEHESGEKSLTPRDVADLLKSLSIAQKDLYNTQRLADGKSTSNHALAWANVVAQADQRLKNEAAFLGDSDKDVPDSV